MVLGPGLIQFLPLLMLDVEQGIRIAPMDGMTLILITLRFSGIKK